MPTFDVLIDAFAWTLVHSTWQLTVVGLLLAGLLAGLGDARADVRYRACLVAMGLCLALPVLTFVRLVAGDVEPGPSVASAMPAAVAHVGWRAALVVIWSAGVVGLLSRLIIGWLRLRGCLGAARSDGSFDEVVASLSERLGVRAAVRVLISASVTVPATVGWLKPVLLLPVGLANALTPRQVEMIIAHELAHVRRLDFLVNVLQSLVETLLFHHPAVWWISRRLRVEREYCCDDLAVLVTGRARDYASALAELETRRQEMVSLSLSANGGSLMSRIRRLLDPAPSSRAGRPLAFASVIATGLMVAAFAAPSVACDEKKTLRVRVSELPAIIEIELIPEEPEEVHAVDATVHRYYRNLPTTIVRRVDLTSEEPILVNTTVDFTEPVDLAEPVDFTEALPARFVANVPVRVASGVSFPVSRPIDGCEPLPTGLAAYPTVQGRVLTSEGEVVTPARVKLAEWAKVPRVELEITEVPQVEFEWAEVPNVQLKWAEVPSAPEVEVVEWLDVPIATGVEAPQFDTRVRANVPKFDSRLRANVVEWVTENVDGTLPAAAPRPRARPAPRPDPRPRPEPRPAPRPEPRPRPTLPTASPLPGVAPTLLPPARYHLRVLPSIDGTTLTIQPELLPAAPLPSGIPAPRAPLPAASLPSGIPAPPALPSGSVRVRLTVPEGCKKKNKGTSL